MHVNLLKILKLSSLASMMWLAGACSSDKSVEPDCELPEMTSLKIHLEVDSRMSEYMTLSEETDSVATRAGAGNGWRLRYTVCIYKEGASNLYPYAAKETLDSHLEFDLPLGKYDVIAWADYVPSETLKSKYYYTDDFFDIQLRTKYDYSGDDPHKVGFVGSDIVAVTYRMSDLKLRLTPAMGQYRISASDSPDYCVSKVIVSYPKGVPASLNALSGKICHRYFDVSFETVPDKFVAHDNVLAENSEIKVPVKIEVYDTAGTLRARRNTLDIPLVSGGVTFVNARIYTAMDDDTPSSGNQGEGGVGIEEDYDDTFVIKFDHV